jgi:hypothetical protein
MWQRQDSDALALIDECQAFLDGRFAQLAGVDGGYVPVWAWLNLLAHGTEAELRAAADRLAEEVGWAQAAAFLAGELIDVVDAGRATLAELQHDILVPLELDVLNAKTTGLWTPGRLVRGVLRILPTRHA